MLTHNDCTRYVQSLNDEQLSSALKSCQQYLKQSRSLVSMKGGWMFWNSEKEEEQETLETAILQEIKARKYANSNTQNQKRETV